MIQLLYLKLGNDQLKRFLLLHSNCTCETYLYRYDDPNFNCTLILERFRAFYSRIGEHSVYDVGEIVLQKFFSNYGTYP